VHGLGRRDAGIADADRYALLGGLLNKFKPEQLGTEMAGIRAAGLDGLHFGWAGGERIDLPHYFRLEGPTTLIEFDNTEDNANHVHCVWRDPTNDSATTSWRDTVPLSTPLRRPGHTKPGRSDTCTPMADGKSPDAVVGSVP